MRGIALSSAGPRRPALALLATSLAVAGCGVRSGARSELARQEGRLEAAVQAGQSDDARDATRRALAAAERAYRSDPLALADSLDRLADALAAEAARTADALATVASLRLRALETRQQALAPDDARIGESLSRLSTAYDAQGLWDPAEANERKALAVFERALGPADPRVGRSLGELATVLYWEGRYQEASGRQDRSLAILEAATPPIPVEVARALNVRMELRRVQGRYEDSEGAGKRAIALLRAAAPVDEALLADLLNNLAGLYKDQGRYDEAETAFREVIDVRRRQEVENASALSIAQLNQGDILRLQGRLEEAEPLFREALAGARRQLADSDPLLATFLNRAALVSVEKGERPAAEPLYREALGLLERTSPGHPDLAQTLHDLAVLRAAEGGHPESRDLFDRSLRIREAVFGPDHAEVALTLVEMARALHREGPGSDAAATAHLERAIGILSATRIYPDALSDALALLAEIRRRGGDREGALDAMRRSLLVVEDMRPRTGGSEATRAQFAARHAERFHRMAAWLLEADRVEAALEWVERGRARVLLDQLALAHVDLLRDVPAEVRIPLERREAEARARLAEAQARLAFTATRGDLDQAQRSSAARSLASQADAAAQELQEAASELRRASPIWRDLVTTGGRPASLAEMRASLLAEDRSLLVYLVGAEDAHLIVVPGRGFPTHHALSLPPAEAPFPGTTGGPLNETTLDRALRGDGRMPGLAASLARRRGLAKTAEEGAVVPGELRDTLFRALVPQSVWTSLRHDREVLVVPDGPLHALPFEALVVGRTNGEPTYWLDEGPIVRYAPSATTARNLARTASEPNPSHRLSALIVAHPLFGRASDDPTPLSRARKGLDSLPPLPGTAAEADAIAAALSRDGADITILRDEHAREASVRAALGERVRPFLHFATHGLVEEEESELRAALALTAPEGSPSGSDDDGLLQLFEIYELDARCELAVLSACDSHAGRRVRGEGVLALSRAFLAAGARRVVASLWPVDDASTAALMGSLYRRLIESPSGQPPDYARALRDARREIRRRPEWADPYYWAPFVISGAP